MQIVEMCCTTCPSGCALHVQTDGENVIGVEGNGCKRGCVFAAQELRDPQRMLTSTVLIELGGKQYLLPVKTRKPVSMRFTVPIMDAVRAVKISHPVHMGDVVIGNAGGSGADVVACRNMGE